MEINRGYWNSYREIIDECIAALDIEIAVLKGNTSRKEKIFEGYFLGAEGGKQLYLFKLEEELYLMDSSPIKVIYGKNTIRGEVIFCERFEILLALEDNIGAYVDEAVLYAEPWKLLVELQERLKETEDKDKKSRNLIKKLMLETHKAKILRGFSYPDRLGQANAIKQAIENDITFIWGPPGTGKTYTLAKIALESFYRDKRVLILSHSNIAVDGAIEAVLKLLPKEDFTQLINEYGDSEKGVFPIARYGYSRLDSIREDPFVNTYNQALRLFKEFCLETGLCDKIDSCQIIEDLEKRIKEIGAEIEILNKSRNRDMDMLRKRTSELLECREMLTKLKKIVRTIEKMNVVPNIKILATTISKTQIDEALYKSCFDVVLVDEVSMAYIPQAFYAASLARKRVIFIGDFRQLAPIAVSEKGENELVSRWLSRDIFEYCQVKECIDKRNFHPRMVLLDEQRRMHPSISRFSNENIYSCLLRDHESVKSKSLSQEVLSFIDTSNMVTVCRRDENGSRLNIINAFIAALIAIRNYEQNEKSVGIITPYNSQSKLVRKILRDIFGGAVDIPINCATVHKFQGSEEDVIIFDTVDSYRMRRAGVLLTSGEREKSERLINVAITRSKHKFIAIANKGYWRGRLGRKDILYKLFNYLASKGTSYTYKNLSNKLDTSNIGGPIRKQFKAYLLYKENCKLDELGISLREDFRKCKEVYLSIPNSTKESLKIIEHLVIDVLKLDSNQKRDKNRVELSIKAENIDLLPEGLKGFASGDAFTWDPVIIIDNKIIYYGIPFVKSEYVAIDVVIRFEGEETTKFIKSKLNLTKRKRLDKIRNNGTISLGEFVENKLRCSSCNHPLTIRKGKRNNFFIGCTNYPNCDYYEPYIKDHILDSYLKEYDIKCDKCSKGMKARVGKYGLFAGCGSYPKCKNTNKLTEFIY